MRQTLITIPHEFAGLPVFGMGWMLLLWLGGSLFGIAWMVRSRGWDDEVRGTLPFVGIVGMAIWLLLPRVEIEGAGLPIRGYGVMLLIATMTGIGLARFRARQVGLAADTIYNLAFCMFVGGILGARCFYVMQYWDSLYDPQSVVQTLVNMVNFVEGGLVVYGSLIGALIAAVWFLRKRGIPVLPIADLIAPSMAIGLAIGRIGCLMNGCCYGDVSHQPWAISFPVSSPPYYHQHALGLLHGFRIDADDEQTRVFIREVIADGVAAKAGVPVGATLQAIDETRVTSLAQAEQLLVRAATNIAVTTDQGDFAWTIGAFPTRSLPIHPTQIYSAINAAILAIVAFAYFPFRQRDGQVFALLMTLYAVTRFILEIIRTDEPSFGGTGMTISQNVSVLILLGVAGILWHIFRQPMTSYWPRPS